MCSFGVFGSSIYDTDKGCPETFSLSKRNRSFLSTSSYNQVVEHFQKDEHRYIVRNISISF